MVPDVPPKMRGVCLAWSIWLHLKKGTVEALFVAFRVLNSSPTCILLCSSFSCFPWSSHPASPNYIPQRQAQRWTWAIIVHFCRLAVVRWPDIFSLKISACSEVNFITWWFFWKIKRKIKKERNSSEGKFLAAGTGHMAAWEGWVEGLGCRSSLEGRWPSGSWHHRLDLGECLRPQMMQTHLGYLAPNPGVFPRCTRLPDNHKLLLNVGGCCDYILTTVLENY